MISKFKCLYCILLFVLNYTLHKSLAISTTEKVARVLNILNQKSWRSYDEPEKGIADQQIFVDENYGKFIDIIRIPSKTYSNNMDVITSNMYVALACKCGETIIDILTIFIKWMDYEQTVQPMMVSTLKKFNETILKSISVMFYFIDIAPNVLYFEPGVLKMAVLINFHLNYLIEKCKIEEYCPLAPTEFVNVIFQMINLLERYTISYCSSSSNKPDPMDYTDCSIYTLVSPQHHLKTQHIINYFENLLDNSGLSISNFYKYNLTNKTSKDMSPDENSLNFNIIVYVLDNFNSLLGNQQIFLKSPEMDIEKVFVDQKSMFDLIMLIFHNYTEDYLVELERYQNNELKSTFLNKSTIMDNQLIECYEELKIESNVKKFPTDFVNQIKLILRILKTIYYSKNILDIDILIINERNQIALLTDRLRNNIELDDNLIGNLTYYTFPEKNDSPLHTFLKNIVSMEYILYFNQIFNLLETDFIEPNIEIHKQLNKIQHVIDSLNINYYCQLVNSVYAFSFDLLSLILNSSKNNNSTPKTDQISIIKNGFDSILIVLKAFLLKEKLHTPDMVTLSYHVIYADQYLSYNLIKFPQNLPLEKLNRILYLVTNFIDRYNVLNCSPLNYRDLIFNEFKEKPAILKKLKNLKHNSWIRYISKSRNELVKTDEYNFGNFVLFDNFLNKTYFEETQLKLFWNGKLKSILNVKDYMNENLFNFSSIPNYVKSFFEWISALLSYNVLNIMNFILVGERDMRQIHLYRSQFKCFKYDFKQIAHFGSNTHELVFNGIRDACNSNDQIKGHTLKFRIFGLKLILESYLKHYTDKFRAIETPQRYLHIAQRRSNTMDELTTLFETVDTVLKIVPADSCKFQNILYPLTYVFADYFDVKRNPEDCNL